MKALFFLLFSTLLFSYPNYSVVLKTKKIYPMGKKIYEQKCRKIDVSGYATYDELYNDLKNSCGILQKRYTEAVTLYLWDNKGSKEQKTYKHFHVSKKEKCPVCGMFLYKYPNWIAKMQSGEKEYYFDGNKDMFKFYFEHDQKFDLLLVPDYYTQQIINAKEAYFVIGSDVYGPMGNELLAFSTSEAAAKFMLDHKGKRLLSFDQITPEIVYGLD